MCSNTVKCLRKIKTKTNSDGNTQRLHINTCHRRLTCVSSSGCCNWNWDSKSTGGILPEAHQQFSWFLNRESGSSPTKTITTWRWVWALIRRAWSWLLTEWSAQSTPSSPPMTLLTPWSRSVCSGHHQTAGWPSSSMETTGPRPALPLVGTLCRLVDGSS